MDAEQTSCTKPGSVSSAERAPPPIVSLASSTSTERPARASAIAAASPFGPRADDDRVGQLGSRTPNRRFTPRPGAPIV